MEDCKEKRNINILISAQLFYPSKVGGPANTLYWLSKGLISKGYTVSVVTTSQYISSKDVVFNKWNLINKVRTFYCKGNSKINFKHIISALKEVNNNDVVILSSLCFLSNFPIAYYSLLKHKRIIWSPRGELMEGVLKNNKFKLCYFKLIKKLYKNKITFHATSEEERVSIQKIFGNTKCVIIPNYMELPNIQERDPESQPYFLYLGRIAPVKSLEKLIEALNLSKKFRTSNFLLKIVGNVEEQFTDYYNKLLVLVKKYNLNDKVLFIGPLFRQEKYKAFANAKFTFLISESENFGNVVIESLSQSTPVVASKGTPWNILTKQNAGYWIENNPQSIALTIDNILSLTNNDYSKFRENASILASSFDIYKNINEWSYLIEHN